jgi:hypothetical protein
MATAILPFEATTRTSSWYPGVYTLSYPEHDRASFTYHLEGDYSDNYQQPNHGLIWLETGRVNSLGLNYTVEMLDSLVAHRIFIIKRGSFITPQTRYSMAPKLKRLPRLFRRQFMTGPHIYLPADFYNSIWVWLTSNPKVTKSQVMNKARTMLTELEAGHVELSVLEELTEMLSLVAGISEDSRITGRHLRHGFSKTQSLKVHTIEAAEDFFVGKWHQKYRERFHKIFLAPNFVPSIQVKDFDCSLQGGSAFTSTQAYERDATIRSLPPISSLEKIPFKKVRERAMRDHRWRSDRNPNQAGTSTGPTFARDEYLVDYRDNQARDDDCTISNPRELQRDALAKRGLYQRWRLAFKSDKSNAARATEKSNERERWMSYKRISSPSHPIMLHPLNELEFCDLTTILGGIFVPGRLMDRYELESRELTITHLPFDWRNQSDPDYDVHQLFEDLTATAESWNNPFVFNENQFSIEFDPLQSELLGENIYHVDDEEFMDYWEHRPFDIKSVCEDYPCCSHCWDCHHNSHEEAEIEEICCEHCEDCHHHPEPDVADTPVPMVALTSTRAPRPTMRGALNHMSGDPQPSREGASTSTHGSLPSIEEEDGATDMDASATVSGISSLASEGHHLRQFATLRLEEREAIKKSPKETKDILKAYAPQKYQALEAMQQENHKLRQKVTKMALVQRKQRLTNSHGTCECPDHTQASNREWSACASGHGWTGAPGGYCHCCLPTHPDDNPNGSWTASKFKPSLPPFCGFSLVSQWPRPQQLEDYRPSVSLPLSDFCGLTTFANFLKKREADVVTMVQDRLPSDILDGIAQGNLNLKHMHYLCMAWNIAAVIHITDHAAWGNHPQRIGSWGGRDMEIRWMSASEHESGSSHWQLEKTLSASAMKPPKSYRDSQKIATPIPEGALSNSITMQAAIKKILPGRSHSLNYDRVKSYLREAKQGHTGTYYRDMNVGLEMLKGWDEIADQKAPRQVQVHVSYGAGGSNKSSEIIEILQSPTYRTPGLWSMCFPRKELRNSTATKLNLSQYGFMCQTFENAAAEGRRKILIVDEITLYPPGFIDFIIMLDPNIQTVVIIGDFAQACFHEPHPQSGFDLSYKNSEVIHFLKYLVNPYRLYSYRHELSEVSGVPWIPAGRKRVTAAKEVLRVTEALAPRTTTIVHSDAFKARYGDGARKTYTYSGCQGGDFHEDIQVIVTDDALRSVNWNGCYTACSRVASAKTLSIVDYSKSLQEDGHALQMNNALFMKYTNLDKSKGIPRANLLMPNPGELLYEMSDVFVEYNIPYITHPNQMKPTYHPFTAHLSLPSGAHSKFDTGNDLGSRIPGLDAEKDAKLDNIRSIISNLTDSPLMEPPSTDTTLTDTRLKDSNLLSDRTFLSEYQLQTLGAREDRELRTERHGMTNLFEDNLTTSRDPKLAKIGQKFIPLLKTIFPHQKNTDNALFQLTIEKRIRLAKPSTNERKYKSAANEGDALFESFRDLLNLREDRVPLDEEELMRCMMSSEETQLAKPLNQLIANYDRAEPEFQSNNPRLFIKSQLKGKTDTLNSPAGKPGQSLALYASKVIHLFGKVGHYLAQKVQLLLPSNIYWHNRMSPRDLDNWVRLHWQDSKGAFSNDFTAYDQSQDQKVLAFEVRLLNYFNIPKELIDEYVWIKLNSHSFPGPLQTMRFTGEWCTLIFNTFMNMAYMNLKYLIPKGMPQCYAGDDSIFNGRLLVKKEWDETRFTLIGKEVYQDTGEFCSWYITSKGIYKNPYVIWLRQRISEEIGTEQLTMTSYFLEFSFLYERFAEIRDRLTPLELEAHHDLTRYYLKNAHLIPGAHVMMKSSTYFKRLQVAYISRRALARLFRTPEVQDDQAMKNAFYATELIHLAERQGEKLTHEKMSLIMQNANSLEEAETLRVIHY